MTHSKAHGQISSMKTSFANTIIALSKRITVLHDEKRHEEADELERLRNDISAAAGILAKAQAAVNREQGLGASLEKLEQSAETARAAAHRVEETGAMLARAQVVLQVLIGLVELKL